MKSDRFDPVNEAMAMNELGLLFGESSLDRWRWFSEAAALGQPGKFVGNFEVQVNNFLAGKVNVDTIYEIGRALRGHVEEGAIFGFYCSAHEMDNAKKSIDLFLSQTTACRCAVDLWVLLARRLGIVKDVRRIIAEEIWKGRSTWNFSLK